MTALSPAVQIAVGLINMAADAVAAARQADEVISGEGADDFLAVTQARRRLRAETLLSTDAFEAALDAADRAATDASDK